jgi:hypothetical protein
MTTFSPIHPHTSSINHRRAVYTAAATALVGTFLAGTLTSASAMPGRDDHPTTAPVSNLTTHHEHGHYVAHGCFITPHTWSDALAGPMPICYTYVP